MECQQTPNHQIFYRNAEENENLNHHIKITAKENGPLKHDIQTDGSLKLFSGKLKSLRLVTVVPFVL
jgi:hypothetical protein